MAENGTESSTATDEAPPAGAAQGGQGSDGRGFPANTPVAEMAPAEQAAYWKHQARKHESAAKQAGSKYADYDEVRSRAEQYDALLATTQSDQERAVAKARKEGADEARQAAVREYGAQLVAARLHSALAGRLDDGQIEGLLEGLDPARFLDAKGAVDGQKVATWVDRVAPKRAADLGQGRRTTPAGPPDMNKIIRRAAGITT